MNKVNFSYEELFTLMILVGQKIILIEEDNNKKLSTEKLNIILEKIGEILKHTSED